jgi:hypothetical protein
MKITELLNTTKELRIGANQRLKEAHERGASKEELKALFVWFKYFDDVEDYILNTMGDL